MKKGLVVIYDPHALMVFLHYYCMSEDEVVWDALCLPKENGNEEMSIYCEKAGVFNVVRKSEIEFIKLPIKNKVGLFCKMFLWAAIGERKKCCEHILNKYVGDIDKYDILASNCENGFISGMFASFGKERTVVFFEDGLGDYFHKRSKWHSCFKRGSFEDIQCVVMARLGYFGKGFTYLKPTKDCLKYVYRPEELPYKNYKDIKRLELTQNQKENNQIIWERIFTNITKMKIEELAKEYVLVLTITLLERNKYSEYYYQKFSEYVGSNHKKILLKRHPRDDRRYQFGKDVSVIEIPKDIPAEILFPYFDNCTCVMMQPDSLIVSMALYNINITFAYCEAYEKECMNVLNTNMWNTKSSNKEFCDKFVRNMYTIIDV